METTWDKLLRQTNPSPVENPQKPIEPGSLPSGLKELRNKQLLKKSTWKLIRKFQREKGTFWRKMSVRLAQLTAARMERVNRKGVGSEEQLKLLMEKEVLKEEQLQKRKRKMLLEGVKKGMKTKNASDTEKNRRRMAKLPKGITITAKNKYNGITYREDRRKYK